MEDTTPAVEVGSVATLASSVDTPLPLMEQLTFPGSSRPGDATLMYIYWYS
jgi:hypothetical protein